MGLCPVMWLAEDGDDCLKQCQALLGRRRNPGIAQQNGQGKKAEKSLMGWKARIRVVGFGSRTDKFPREMGWGRYD